jgi:O-methyltransferase
MNSITSPAVQIERKLRAAVFKSPARRLLTKQWPEFQFSMPQLAFLGQTLQDATQVDGSVVEIGVSGGETTIYLNKWLNDIGRKRPYYAVDTFAGFTEADLQAEAERGNTAVPALRGFFLTGTQESYNFRLQVNGVTGVTTTIGDAAILDYVPYAPIAFALVDVDLYRPVIHALRSVRPLMTPGGIIVVDDCQPVEPFNGAHAAYLETCVELGIDPVIEHDKLGVIRT